MTEQPKSLLPYNEDYVLMHKRTLLVNSAVLSAMIEFIAKDKNAPPEVIAAGFGISAAEFFNQMTDEQISNRANSVVANCWQLNQTKLVVTTDVTTEIAPPDEAV